jgi:hypothetical protein
LALTVDQLSSWVIFSGTDQFSNLILGGLNIFNNPSVSSLSFITVLAAMKATSISIGSPDKIFVASKSNLPQTPPSSSVS